MKVTIGGRDFDVACQPGEEHFLSAAASLLDAEASVLINQIGRMPEARMLLMSGLMLADKTAGLEDRVRELDRQIAHLETELDVARAKPPVRVEVPVIPAALADTLAELAARAEALAEEMEEAGTV